MSLKALSDSRKKTFIYLSRYIDILNLQIKSIADNDIEKLILQSEAAVECMKNTQNCKKTADSLCRDLKKNSYEKNPLFLKEEKTFKDDFEKLAVESSKLNTLCSGRLEKLMKIYGNRLECVKNNLSDIAETNASDVEIQPPQMLDISV